MKQDIEGIARNPPAAPEARAENLVALSEQRAVRQS